MIKKILSYIYPVTILNKTSNISKSLEVTLYNGKTMLNTKNTNYSFGSLQKVLKKGLLTIGQNEIDKMNSILILGVAGGSVVQTLVNDFSYSNLIIGVELDQEVIEIANSYFGLNTINNFKCYIEDAEKFVSHHKEKHDLIIIDIFKDTEMPEFLFQESFLSNVKQLLQKNGYIIFNSMILDKNKTTIYAAYLQQFNDDNFEKKIIKNVEQYNDLIIIKSL